MGGTVGAAVGAGGIPGSSPLFDAMDDAVIAHLRWVLAVTGSGAIRGDLRAKVRKRRERRLERRG
jgi:hypothetical protein